jgi:hypothetical protein
MNCSNCGNEARSSITQLLGFQTALAAEAVPQNIQSPSFEIGTEFGVPKRAPAEALFCGYKVNDFDLSSRLTWKFLRDANAEQVRSIFTGILNADNKLTTGKTLRRLMNPNPEKNNEGIHALRNVESDLVEEILKELLAREPCGNDRIGVAWSEDREVSAGRRA